MKCLDCEDMACKTFYHKSERWEGYCMNKQSPRYHTLVTGEGGCKIYTEQSLFNN